MTAQQTVATPAAKSKTPWSVYAAVAALVGLVALVVSRPASHTATPEELKADASRACQKQFIADRLKAPSTAKYSNVTVTESTGHYTVMGSVDAQNSFGAPIRSGFVCTMHSAGGRWVLDSAAVN